MRTLCGHQGFYTGGRYFGVTVTCEGWHLPLYINPRTVLRLCSQPSGQTSYRKEIWITAPREEEHEDIFPEA